MFNEYISWAAMIEIPVFAAIFRMLGKHRQLAEETGDGLKEALAEFKIHVARNYVSVNYLKDVEDRLTNHLLRIENKLDERGGRK